MIEPVPFSWRGDFVKGPLLGRLVPVRLRIAEIADHVRALLEARVKDQLRFPVAGEISKRGRFVVGVINREMLFPVTFLAAGVLVPIRRSAGEAEDQNVVPAIFVEVVSEGEKVVRVG